MALVLKLRILAGRHIGREIEVQRSKFVIGRADDCDLRPASPAVSRRHCALIVESGRVRLQDLGTANGTLVNGQRIDGECDLASGDRITIGPLEFQAIIAAPAPPPESAPAKESQPLSAKQPPAATGQTKAQAGGTPPAKGGSSEDDIMQWLAETPSDKPKSIYVRLDAEAPTAPSADTGRIGLDGTQAIAWPESPPVASTLPPSAPVSQLLNSGKPVVKLADPNAAGNTRDAAAAAIDAFRHRNDKPRPANK
jgi:pSer/pThr/pTyr-binding forkhead associated (FHA) protein